MNEFLQQIINGLALGAIYALIALGYTMIYGVLRFINFAHGDVFMVGAYIGYYAYPKLVAAAGDGYTAAAGVLLAAMLGCGLLGVIIEFLAYRPLRNRPKLTVLITAIGVSLFLEYTGQLPMVFGADYKTFPTLVPYTSLVDAGGIHLSSNDVLVFVVAISLMVLLRIIVMNTKIGTAMRAVSMNMSAASLMGININRVISFTFFLGSALAGAGAILTYLPEWLRDIDIAGVSLSEFRMSIYALALIVLMLLRPQGLFGDFNLLRSIRAIRSRKQQQEPVIR